MTKDQREIHRKKRILEYAEQIGNINHVQQTVVKCDGTRWSGHHQKSSQ